MWRSSVRGQTGLRAFAPRLAIPRSNGLGLALFSTQKIVQEAAKPPTEPKPQLHENLWTVPNALTVSRLLASPAIGYLIVQGNTPWAVGLFAYSCVTDLLDGWIARKFNAQSVVGSVLDPAADKMLMVTLTSCLTFSGAVPWWCGTVILGRDVFLGVSAFYLRYVSLPAPKTFQRYWDMSIPSVQVYPSQLSKWNTFFQMVYLGLTLVNPVLPLLSPEVQTGLAVFVTTTTTATCIDYLKNRPYKFIK